MVILVILVACGPLAIVAGFNVWERGTGARMEANVVEAVASTGDPAAVASEYGVWLRILDGDSVVEDHDGEASSWRIALRSRFLRADGAPPLREADAARASLIERPEVRAAREGRSERGCRNASGGRLLICHATRALPDGRVAYALESSRRPIRVVYDLRYHLAKLTLATLPVALFLAWWLGRRMVRPLEQLQAQARQQAGRPGARIELRRQDEFGDVADAFNQLLGTLEERSQANEAFVADLVHEFKNPVAAIRAASESLEGGAPSPERAARLARILRDSSQRLDDLVTTFLELARAEAGLPDESREPVDLAALLQARAGDASITLDAGPHVVDGVSSRLDSVVRNLLDNAASFADPERPEVRASLRTDGRTITLEVEDNGAGIAADDLPRVFERFFTRRQTGRGTGLGLALVRAVAEAHAGSAVAENGQIGARFRVRLPASARSGVKLPEP